MAEDLERSVSVRRALPAVHFRLPFLAWRLAVSKGSLNGGGIWHEAPVRLLGRVMRWPVLRWLPPQCLRNVGALEALRDLV